MKDVAKTTKKDVKPTVSEKETSKKHNSESDEVALPEESKQQDSDETKRTWGKVMVMQSEFASLDLVFPEKGYPEKSVEIWVPLSITPENTSEAERYIKEGVEEGSLPGGKYIIARRVKGLVCEVKQVRTVQVTED